MTGEWKDSGLGEAFRAAKKNPRGLHEITWKPYGPSAGALASFLATGVYKGNELIGVFSSQLPPETFPVDSAKDLRETTQLMKSAIQDFTFGKPQDGISPAPTQAIVDQLQASSDLWSKVEPIVLGALGEVALASARALSPEMQNATIAIGTALVDGAWQGAPELAGQKISLASAQVARLQSMCTDGVMMSMGAGTETISAIEASMQIFEDNHKLLVSGNGEDGKANIPATSLQGRPYLDSVHEAWGSFRGNLQQAIDKFRLSQDQFEEQETTEAERLRVRGLKESADSAVGAMLEASNFFATEAGQVELPAFEILAPIPLTGDWPAGQTFRTAALFAEGLINQEQFLLPGYRIKHVFQDDQCDESVATDVVLSEISVKDTYIGIGGLGCSKSCSRLASFTTSMKLPVVSYGCPAPELSDVETYPALTRLGTVTTGFVDVIKRVKETQGGAAWTQIYVMSGDEVKYGEETKEQVNIFNGAGLSAEQLSTDGKNFDSMASTMADLKAKTAGEPRVVFVVGSENFFRRLICASIVAGHPNGIVWLSQGTWRSEWWKKTDTSTMFYTQWLKEDTSGKQLKDAFAAFKQTWGEFRSNVADTRKELGQLYTSSEMVRAQGEGAYHVTHGEWHPIFRQMVRERKYYDMYLIDTDGNVVFSEAKRQDFATNIASANGGLSEVFAAAMAKPDEVSLANSKPYAGDGDRKAAFFATGLRDEEGNLVGVYVIRPPLDFEDSVEFTNEECSLEAITAAYEGGLNVGGHGQVIGAAVDERMACFKGHSPRSLMQLVNLHWATGYPKGDVVTQVADPFNADAAHAVDGVCAYAMTVKHMLAQGHSMEQIQKPDNEVYAKINTYMRTELDFLGASGQWKFEGNDKPAALVLHQVQSGFAAEVGMLFTNKTIAVSSVDSSMWTAEKVDGFKHMWILPVLLGFVLCCLPVLAACAIVCKRRSSKQATQEVAAGSKV